MRVLFSAKEPGETVTLTFDFTAALGTGELLAGIQSVAISTLVGTDPAPSAVIDGMAIIAQAGTAAQQMVQGGIAGCSYLIDMTVITSAGQVLILSATLPVR